MSANSSISRVRHSDGRVLAEVRRNADIVEFRIADATFTLNTANQSFVNFSNENQVRLQEFLQSNNATIARSCLKNLLQTLQSARDNRGRRVKPLGLSLISMLLGEDQPSTNAPQSKLETLNHSRLLQNAFLVQSNAVKGLPRFATTLTPCASLVKAGLQDDCPFGPNQGCFGGSGCNGCCAIGCTGCQYWTNECLTHDNCVGSYGHVACLGSFPAAAGSLIRAANRGYGDWGSSEPDTWFLLY